jgi:asparagine synthase (glutamine-hydrolysing)
MDSSSIVCMADTIIARGAADTPRLDTVSYYSDSEPNWNERPYFTKVEEKRGQTGCHIDVGSQETLRCEFESHCFAATPGSLGRPNESTKQFAAHMNSQGNRVVLSGIGGDEVTGGVPTPTTELEDLLASGRFGTLARQLKIWALNKRRPWSHLFFEAVRGFFGPILIDVPEHKRPVSWLDPDFVGRNRTSLTGYQSRLSLLGPLPSFQENLATLDMLRRQLGCTPLPTDLRHEKRYPYLDRNLLEFLFALPREQLVRPGQRRSLMRRALVGIVPEMILNRKRKAYAGRSLMTAISREWPSLVELSQHLISGSLRIIDPKRFFEVLQKAHRGEEIPLVLVARTLLIERWLRALQGANPRNSQVLDLQLCGLGDGNPTLRNGNACERIPELTQKGGEFDSACEANPAG